MPLSSVSPAPTIGNVRLTFSIANRLPKGIEGITLAGESTRETRHGH